MIIFRLFIIIISFRLFDFRIESNDTCSPLCIWLPWLEWEPCSRTCGGGIQARKRPLCCNLDWTFAVCVNKCEKSYSDGFDDRLCNTHCLNGGTYSYWCHCTDGFYGTCCSNDIDECAANICQNGGTCENTHGSYNCDCTENWGGKDCTTDLCKTIPTNLIFLVDSSYSTTSAMFQKQLDYVADVISKVTITDDRFRVAVITYSTFGYSDITFDSYENKTDLLAQVCNIKHRKGTSHIERGCDEALRLITLYANSAQIVFLLTDGMQSDVKGSIESILQFKRHLYTSSISNRVIIIPFGDDVRHDVLYRMSHDRYLQDIQAPFYNAPLFNAFQALVDRRCTACYNIDKYDVAILVDTSFALDLKTFYLQLTFLQKLIEKIHTFVMENIYQIGNSHVQLGMVTFSDTPEPFLWLNTTHDLDHFARMVNSLQKDILNSSSELSIALKFVNDKFLFNGTGARSNARKLVIVLNTGLDSNESASMNEVANLKQTGTLVVAIGIGDKFKDDNIIAQASSAYHAYFIDNSVSDIYVSLLAKDLVYKHCTDRINA